MKNILGIFLLATLSLYGCGQKPAENTADSRDAAEAQMPKDAVHGQMGDTTGAEHEAMQVNTDVNLTDAIKAAWSGAIVEVKTKDGAPQRYTLKLGEAAPLGDTGLTATALAFVPDFVMDDSGITSRSAEAKNTALEVLIQEEGKPDYKGWLFGAMPSIHPFPHDTYSVILIKGVPTAK